MKMNDKASVGCISIEVKAGFSLDTETARICMDLLAIHYKNRGCKGVVLKFNDDCVEAQLLLSNDAVDVAMAAPLNCDGKVDNTRGTGLWQPGDED